MRALLLCSLTISVHTLNAQWTITSAPNNGVRKDDICFIGPDTGWVAGGADGIILRTYDGGETWQTVYTGPDHLRSIEFATKEVGFSGSVSGTFLRTLDGGDSWQDITDSITGASSICGLCAASPEVIYGCGVWFQPAYVIRSTDGGMNWDKTNLNSMASALIDVLFLNADTGFVSGKAQPPSLGGIILATVDGEIPGACATSPATTMTTSGSCRRRTAYTSTVPWKPWWAPARASCAQVMRVPLGRHKQ